MEPQQQNPLPGSSTNETQPTPPASGASPPQPGSTPSATGSGQPPPAAFQPKPPASGKRRRMSLVLGLIIVIAAVLAGAYLVHHKSQTTTNSTATVVKKPVALLRMGVTQPFPVDWYPNIFTNNFAIELNSQIFEGLTKYQNENQIVPGLAKSWTNPDSLTWVFKLLPNVKFHDGQTMTSEQVKASLEALGKTSFGQPYTSTVKSVDAPDSSTVKITTNAPDPLLPNELANLAIYDTNAATPNDPANGTGPYTIKPGTKLNASSVRLVAFDGYHGGTVLAKELNFTYFADIPSETKAIQQNQLDIADLGNLSTVDTVTSYGFSAYAYKNPHVYFLMPNTLKAGSPLQKLAVRQALYEALDPNALMKANNLSGTPATQLVPQEIPGYNPAIKRPPFNTAKAKTDLAAAGYPSGFTITFTYYAPHQVFATEVQKELAAIGVTLTMDPESQGSVLQQKALSGQTDLYYFGFGSSLIDTSDVAQPLVVDTANYKNSQVDALYNQAATTLGTTARLKLLQQLNQVVMSDVAVMPLFTPEADYFAVRSNLSVRTDNLFTYSGIDFSQVYAN